MFFSGSLLFFLQIALCVHVIRAGRPYWWLWLIWFAPGLGCLVYIIVEVLPEYRVSNFQDFLWLFKTKTGRVKALRDRVEESPSVDHRRALAAEMKAQGNYQDALGVLQASATGVFKDDAYLLKELAEAHIGLEDWKNGKAVLDRVKTTDPILKPKLKVLEARCLAGLGKKAEAEKIWRDLEPGRLTEEPVYRLALAALEAGDREGARAKFTEITRRYRKGNAIWRLQEKTWFKLAKQKISEIG